MEHCPRKGAEKSHSCHSGTIAWANSTLPYWLSKIPEVITRWELWATNTWFWTKDLAAQGTVVKIREGKVSRERIYSSSR